MRSPVRARVVDLGNVRIEPIGGGAVQTIERGVVIQFDNVDDFKAAVAATVPVRLEWQLPSDCEAPQQKLL